jgi:hypothetical protein
MYIYTSHTMSKRENEMTKLKAAFAKRFENMSDAERAAKAARLREILGRVRGAEHALRNTAERAAR